MMLTDNQFIELEGKDEHHTNVEIKNKLKTKIVEEQSATDDSILEFLNKQYHVEAIIKNTLQKLFSKYYEKNKISNEVN